jgi:hypothetical protein
MWIERPLQAMGFLFAEEIMSWGIKTAVLTRTVKLGACESP